ncbi:nucleotidyltransferase family protein [Brachybacterium sp. YJGR34]|uniref:nucleotidyltransferase family protein n=1 Tax=Brachybacterium sp. YJGR34 TaxID=2059911 RepID=UPI000E0AB150|nr:nucleotidyltransferase family protein [Brachybacterium sp. YJGR34]
MDSPVQVPTAVRLRMAHGCLQLLAEGAGLRILHLKGVALDPRLAAGRGGSSDCDLLVAPDQVEELREVLAAHGWEQITTFDRGSVFGHAAAFHHPRWGTADVHRAFPGVDRSPETTFARLWRAREERVLGGVPCPVPDLLGQRLLLLVHAARDRSARAAHDVRESWTRADAAERARLEDLAGELGGTVPLALVAGRPERARGGPDEHLWRALHAGAPPRQVWRARWRDARSPRARVRILAEAAAVNRDHLSLRLGRTPTRRELRREWFARWGRLLRP